MCTLVTYPPFCCFCFQSTSNEAAVAGSGGGGTGWLSHIMEKCKFNLLSVRLLMPGKMVFEFKWVKPLHYVSVWERPTEHNVCIFQISSDHLSVLSFSIIYIKTLFFKMGCQVFFCCFGSLIMRLWWSKRISSYMKNKEVWTSSPLRYNVFSPEKLTLHFRLLVILFIFCIAGTLGKIQLPAQKNKKQHKPSSRLSYLVSGQQVFIIFSLVEATNKPLDTAEKLTVTVQGLSWSL